MSKIALTPNASGTGTFTLAAPNSNTSRTITLPDEAGEVLVNGTTQNVGIGTSSPSFEGGTGTGLEINNSSGNGAHVKLTDAASGAGGTNGFDLYAFNTSGYIENYEAGSIVFRNNGSERCRITSSGNVGIGTSSPAAKLSITENIVGDLIKVTGANATDLRIGNHALANGGIYINSQGGSGDLRLQTQGSTRMTLDSSGNVGIGTSSPVSAIHASGLPTDGILGTFATTAGTYGSKLAINQAGVANWRIGQPAGVDAFAFYGFGAGTYPERMRIDSSGNLLVGTTDSTYGGFYGQMIHAVTDADNYAGIVANATRSAGNQAAIVCNVSATSSNLIAFEYLESRKGSITTNGTSTSYNTTSDYRLKTDAQPMTGASARVQALSPVNFEWIADGTRVDGFLAHEAQAVVPEAVTGTKDAMRDEEYEVTPAVYEDVVIPAVLDDEGNELEAERTEQQLVTEAVMGTRSVPDYQGIDQSKLVPLLTAALQEALTEISDLKARVVALEAV